VTPYAGFSSVGSALALQLQQAIAASSNPVVGVSVNSLQQTVKLHSLSAPAVGCSTDTSPWSTMVECGWRVDLKLVRKLTSSLTRVNSYIIVHQPWASWITGVVS
jgi:hypothetical protein